MDADQITARREQLIENGYRPVPVKTRDKRPHGFGWQKCARDGIIPPATAATLSTGILCDGLRAVDIDIDDQELHDQIEALVSKHLGSGLIRFRDNSPRHLLLFRAAEGEPDKKAEKGSKGAVEVLGHGQQFVAFGTHPSGAEYQWQGDSPLDQCIDDLIRVSEEQIAELLAEIRPLIGHQNRFERPPPQFQPTPPQARSDTSTAEVRDLLFTIPPDCPYDDWLNALMAVHAATGGSSEGLAMADEWSAGGSKYKKGEVAAKWKSFRSTGVTVGTLADLARQYGANLSQIAKDHFTPEPIDPAVAKSIDAMLQTALKKRGVKTLTEAEAATVTDTEEDDENVGGALDYYDLPDSKMRPGGLVEQITDWICQTTGEPLRIHALGAALVTVGTLAARKVYTESRPTGTHLYVGAMAPSGFGKSHPQICTKMILDKASEPHPGHHMPWAVSAPKLGMSLLDRAGVVMLADEFADKLQSVRGRNASTATAALNETFRELWGLSQSSYSLPGALSRVDATVHRPGFSFYGAATIRDFKDSLVGKDVTNGLYNRFLFLPRYGKVARGAEMSGSLAVPDHIARQCAMLKDCLTPLDTINAIRGDIYPANPIYVPFSPDAATLNEENRAHQQAMMDRADDEGAHNSALALYARYAEQIKRIALIIAAGRYVSEAKIIIQASDMEFARSLVQWSIEQTVIMVRRDMVENETESDFKKVLGLIRGKKMIPRSRLMRAIKKKARDLDDILNTLIQAENIEEVQIPSKTKTARGYRYLRG